MRREEIGTKESGASKVSFASSGSGGGSQVRFEDEQQIDIHNRISEKDKRMPFSSKDSTGTPANTRVQMSTKESQKSRKRDPGRSSGTRDSKDTQGSADSRHSGSFGSRHSGSGKSSKDFPDGSPNSSAPHTRVTTKDTTGTGGSYSSGTGSSGSEYSQRVSGSNRRGSVSKKKGKKGMGKSMSHQRSRTRSRSRSTHGSHSRSGSNSKSGDSSESWSSSSSEDLMDQDLSKMDQSILPLHLREGLILSKEDAFITKQQSRANIRQNNATGKRKSITGEIMESEEEEEDPDEFEWKDPRSKFKIFLSKFLGHEDGTAFTSGRHGKDSILMNNWQFAIRIYPCAAWTFVVLVLMFIFLARYFEVVEPEGQRMIVLKLMLQTEVSVAASLAPAFRVVSSLALAAQAGVLNTSSWQTSYTSLSNILAPELNMGPHINFVKVVGASDYTTLLRPGRIHVERLATIDRAPLVFAAPVPCGSVRQDPMRCLSLNNSALIDVPRDAAALRWQRPAFLTYDGALPIWIHPDERMDPTIDYTQLNTFAHRLVAYINASNATTRKGGRGPIMAVEVGIDLAGVQAAMRTAAAKDGATYVCTADGTVIAGSNWFPEATAMYDPVEGLVVYPTLWDLGFSWMEAISPKMVAGRRQAEAWSGSDIVVARPLAVGDQMGASYLTGLADLRIVSMAPRAVGTTADFKALVHGAIGVMGAPGVFLLVALIVLAAHGIFMAVMRFLFNHWH